MLCRFKRLREKLGLGKGVFPYGVRARFTSDAINNGNANPALIAKQLGHTGLEMLTKHYSEGRPRSRPENAGGDNKKTGGLYLSPPEPAFFDGNGFHSDYQI